MPDNQIDPCKICTEHSGLCVKIEQVEQVCKDQWEEINWMKRFLIGSLFTMIIVVIGIGVNIYITLTRFAVAGTPTP